MNMLRCRRKAISPVVATLLLILIAVAASVIVYVWITGYLGASTPASTPELQEKIKIEAISYSDNTLTIYVRNIGDVGANITAAYVINATSYSVLYANTSLAEYLKPGELATSVTINNANLSSGVTYIVKVVTKNGVEASTVYTPG